MQEPYNIQDENLSDVSPRPKFVEYCHKSTIPDLLRVLEEPRLLWKIIKNSKLVSKI